MCMCVVVWGYKQTQKPSCINTKDVLWSHHTTYHLLCLGQSALGQRRARGQLPPGAGPVEVLHQQRRVVGEQKAELGVYLLFGFCFGDWERVVEWVLYTTTSTGPTWYGLIDNRLHDERRPSVSLTSFTKPSRAAAGSPMSRYGASQWQSVWKRPKTSVWAGSASEGEEEEEDAHDAASNAPYMGPMAGS